MSRAAARSAFDGLSVGDGLGQTFFADREHADALAAISARRAPPAPWRPCSDDTVMASAILHGLERDGRVDQDALAADFARRFALDPERRGYGPMAYWLLHQLAAGRPWREVSPEVFRGQGSLGNGGAMRVAPLGAFFAGDLARVVAEARASAEVTHFHPDGQAGAIAVAVATALLVRGGEGGAALLDGVAARTPEGETRAGVLRARALLGASVVDAAAALGDGRLVRSSDTAPFALWRVARHPRSYEDAVWLALGGLTEPESDRDTTLAIVGGVVGAVDPPPPSWVAAREPLVGPLFEVL